MASDPPDPQTLESWEDAFQYPIPVVRRLETQLRGEMASNKEKLRTLVGASYRELLGTAEMIVGMDEQIHAVESNLATVGRNCNSRTVERKSDNFARLQHRVIAEDQHVLPLASQLALLHKCSRAISQILWSRRSILLAAKVLVISRLVHKSLSSRMNPPPFLETIRDRLASQRRSLLRHVDLQLASPEASLEGLVEALSAFCLATSSSSSNAMRHFLHVRHEGIRTSVQTADPITKNILKSLKMYIQTQQTTKALFPRRLAEALTSLRSCPLLAQSDILHVEELELELHGRWIDAEVRNFTPWIKSDNIPKLEMQSITSEWNGHASEALMAGLTTNLRRITDFKELIGIRQVLMHTWLSAQSSVLSTSSNVLDQLRGVINTRLLDQIRTQVDSLEVVGSSISSALDSWVHGDQGRFQSLWDGSLMNMDFSKGGSTFKREIVNRSYGRNPAILRVLKPYLDYLSKIKAMENLICELKTTRWEDSFDEEEEDFAMEPVVSLLNEEDPNILEEDLRKKLGDSFDSLQTSIHNGLQKIPSGEAGDMLGFLMRLTREIRQSCPESLSRKDFGTNIMDEAHRLLAAEVSKALLLPFKRSMGATLKRRRVVGRSLWEGDPAFPIQPSPHSFSLLKQAMLAMSDYGTDLWTPAAVEVLKSVVEAEVAEIFQGFVKEHAGDQLVNGLKSKVQEEQGSIEDRSSEGEAELQVGAAAVNGVDDSPRSADTFRDTNIQLLFDALYLQAAFSDGVKSPDKPREALAVFVEGLTGDMHLEGSSLERLRKGARDYWSRTSLLFGLLTA